MRIIGAVVPVAVLLALACISALAQQVTGTPGSPGAPTTIDGKQLPHLSGSCCWVSNLPELPYR